MADCDPEDSTAPKAKEAPLRDPRLRAAAALIERLQGNAHAANTRGAALARRYNSLRELNKWSAERACDALLAVFGHALPAPELAVRRRRAELSFLRARIADLST